MPSFPSIGRAQVRVPRASLAIGALLVAALPSVSLVVTEPASAAVHAPSQVAIALAAKPSKTTVAPTTTTAAVAPAKVTNVRLSVEAKLVKLQTETSPNLAIGKATCPPEMAKVQLKAKTAASKPVTFRCTVLVEGVAAPYDVEVSDGGFLNGGSFLISRAKAIIDVSKVVAGTIAQLDASDRSKAKVACGKAKVVVASIGDQLTCTVDYGAAAGKQTIVYVVKDLDGTIALRL